MLDEPDSLTLCDCDFESAEVNVLEVEWLAVRDFEAVNITELDTEASVESDDESVLLALTDVE